MSNQAFNEKLLEASAGMTATGKVLMQGRREVGYEAQGQDAREQMAELKEALAKQQANLRAFPTDNTHWHGPNRDDTPDHLSVSNMVNLLATDARQLLEEIVELRSRLSPILSEQKTPPQERRATAPVFCKMAHELAEVEDLLKVARENVYLTISQLDL